MSQLAIKGHPTRSKEVIGILSMLGGTNRENCWGIFDTSLYLINALGDIEERSLSDDFNYQTYTLEEFLEKFPYKIGDKVTIEKYKQIFEILSVRWCTERNIIMYQTSNGWYCADKLQPYKEETMEETIKIDIPKGYEFTGVDDDNQQVVFTKIQPQYPKTYEECCEILEVESEFTINDLTVNEKDFLKSIIKLKECREAYWIIAGFWKPDFTNKEQKKFTISFIEDEIYFSGTYVRNSFLVFPTAETRDAFYENFKELIESCKELL